MTRKLAEEAEREGHHVAIQLKQVSKGLGPFCFDVVEVSRDEDLRAKLRGAQHSLRLPEITPGSVLPSVLPKLGFTEHCKWSEEVRHALLPPTPPRPEPRAPLASHSTLTTPSSPLSPSAGQEARRER